MPKVTWGGDLTAEDIDSAELSDFKPYAGAVPPTGVYRFTLIHGKVGESKNGNPKITWGWRLDGTWQKDHKRYDGCPLWDQMPMTASSAFRSKAFLAALGLSSADLLKRTVRDEEDIVTKIGKMTFGRDSGIQVFISVKREDDPTYGVRLALNGTGYLATESEEDDDAEGDADDEGGDPF